MTLACASIPRAAICCEKFAMGTVLSTGARVRDIGSAAAYTSEAAPFSLRSRFARPRLAALPPSPSEEYRSNERPVRQEPPAPPATRRRARDRDPRRARAQSQERRRRDPARPARGVHRPVGLGQVVARLRHDLCRGPAPLRRVALGLCAAVPGDDAEARRRPDRRPLAGDLDRAEDHLEEPALDRRHRHRDLRLHAAAVGARRRALFAGDRPADRKPDRHRRWSTG